MFKSLKKKIQEGVANAPAKLDSSMQNLSKFAASVGSGGSKQNSDSEEPQPSTTNPDHPNRTVNKANDVAPHVGVLVDFQDGNVTDGSVGQFSIDSPDDSRGASAYESALADMSAFAQNQSGPAELSVTSTQEVTSRSRTSSISSVTSDASSFFAPLPPSARGPLPSDMESASEVEDSGVAVGSISKEDLYRYFIKMQRRSEKYKAKFVQVLQAYKDIERERDKLRSTLTTSQDKAFRRISELKEQTQLDKLAKQHIEENYTLMLEEKGELIKVLQTQVNLLKEGKDLPDELEQKRSSTEDKVRQLEEQRTSTPSKARGDTDDSAGAQGLREKVKRLEILLQKCKETIKSNKERTSHLSADKDSLQKSLEWKEQEIAKAKEVHKETVGRLQGQMKEARRVIEELETSSVLQIAEAKQQVHTTIESKDNELQQLRASMSAVKQENDELAAKIQVLEKKSVDHLEKSRDIIKRLKEEKRHLEAEMEQRINSSEQSMENEKESEIQELRRGKIEALQVMQHQMEMRLKEKEEEKGVALQLRDNDWREKLTQVEKETSEEIMRMKTEKDAECARILSENESDMSLAIEERELQKMAALSQQDTQKDQLQQQLEDYVQKCKDHEAVISKLQEASEVNLQAWTTKADENRATHERELNELVQKHENEKTALTQQHVTDIEEKISEVRGEFKQRLDQLNQHRQQQNESSAAEIEEMYKTQIEEIKVNNDKAMKEEINQLEQFRKQVQDLSDTNQRLGTEIEQYQHRVSELEKYLHESAENTSKLDKDKHNLALEFETQKTNYEKRLGELNEEYEKLKINFEGLTGSNDELLQKYNSQSETMTQATNQISEYEKQLKAVTTERDNLQQRLNDTKEEFVEDIDSKNKEIGHLKTQHDEQIRIEFEKSERVLAQKVEEAKLQQSSASDVSVQLSEQLSNANCTITSLEQAVQESKSREVQLTEQCENVREEFKKQLDDMIALLAQAKFEKAERESELTKEIRALVQEKEKVVEETEIMKTDYESRLNATQEHLNSLKTQIDELVGRENQLNSELDETRNGYETQIRDQNRNLHTLREQLQQQTEREEGLKEQMKKLEGDYEVKMVELSEQKSVEMRLLQEQLLSNQAELTGFVYEIEGAYKESQQIVAELTTENESKSQHIEMLTFNIQQLEETLNQKSESQISCDSAQNASETPFIQQEEIVQNVPVVLQNSAPVHSVDAHEIHAQSDALNHISSQNEQVQAVQQQVDEQKEGNGNSEKELAQKVVQFESQLATKQSEIELLTEQLNALRGEVKTEDQEEQTNNDNDMQKHANEVPTTNDMQKHANEVPTTNDIQKHANEVPTTNDSSGQVDNDVASLKAKISELGKQQIEKDTQMEESNQKYTQLKTEAKTKIKTLKDEIQELTEKLQSSEKECESLVEKARDCECAMKEASDNHLSELQQLKADSITEVQALQTRFDMERDSSKQFKENVKKQFEERQGQVKVTISKLKEKFQENLRDRDDVHQRKMANLVKEKDKEKADAIRAAEEASEDKVNSLRENETEQVTFLKAELESSKAKLQDVTAQLTSEKESLLKHAEECKAELTQEVTSLQQENSSCKEQLEKLRSHTTKLESEIGSLTKKNETAEQKLADMMELKERMQELTSNRDSLETQLSAIQVQVSTQKEAFEKAIIDNNTELDNVRMEYNERIEILTSEHNRTLDEKLNEIQLNSSVQSEENTQTLQQKDSKITELEKKFSQLKDKAQSRIADLKKIVEVKEQTITNKTENCAAKDVIISEHVERCAEQKHSYEKKLENLTQNDSELQQKLSELTEKLGTTEEKMTSITQDFENAVENYQLQLKNMQTEYQEKLQNLNSQLSESERHTTDSREEFDDTVRLLKETINANETNIIQQSEQLQDKLDVIQNLQVELSEQNVSKEKFQTSQNEVTNQCVQLEDQMSTLNSKLSEIQEVKDNLESTLNSKDVQIAELNSQVCEKDSQISSLMDEYDNRISDLKRVLQDNSDASVIEQQNVVDGLHQQISSLKTQLQQNANELQRTASELDVKSNELDQTSSDFEQKLSEFEHNTTEVQRLSNELEQKSNQLSESENVVSALKDEKDALNNQLKLAENSWNAEKAEFEAERRKIEAELQTQLESKESVIQESLQKADSRNETEVKLKVLVKNLKKERNELNSQIEQLQTDLQHYKEQGMALVATNSSLVDSCEIDRLKQEYDERIRDQIEDQTMKVKVLAKEFQAQMNTREREFQETLSAAYDKSSAAESQTAYAHRKEMKELHSELNEKDVKCEEMCDEFQQQLQEKEAEHGDRYQELVNRVEKEREKWRVQQAEYEALSMVIESRDVQRGSQAERFRTQLLETAAQLEKSRTKHRLEASDLRARLEVSQASVAGGDAGQEHGDQIQASPDDVTTQQLKRLELQNMDLQAQIIEQASGSAKLKLHQRLLEEDLLAMRDKLVTYETNPPPSPFHSNNTSLDTSHNLGEYTETEYLRNILYEYMMGKETKTLSKVISSVVKFSKEQARRIEEREELKTSVLYQLGSPFKGAP